MREAGKKPSLNGRSDGYPQLLIPYWCQSRRNRPISKHTLSDKSCSEKLLRAKDFQEAFRIQVEHFQPQLKVIAEDANKLGAQIASSLKPPTAA
jgi:hypothetical protein